MDRSLYTAALFLHVVGALLLMATLTVEGIALWQIRRAPTVERVRDSAAIASVTRQVGPASAVGILLPGLYMTATTWGFIPWIGTSLIAWLVVGALGAVNSIRLGSLGRAVAAGGGRFSTAAAVGIASSLPAWRAASYRAIAPQRRS